MTKRKTLSRLARVKIFDAAHGVCCICKVLIDAGRGQKWGVEHIKPLWLGGADDPSNMAPAHERCMIGKTSEEAPVKAKSDRTRANYLGIKKKPKGRPLPGSKASGWKRTMDGRWIKRKE